MADYTEFVKELDKALDMWTVHIATCKRCAIWYHFRAHDPPTAGLPCEAGSVLLRNILNLLG
jgi:hypothetical protein